MKVFAEETVPWRHHISAETLKRYSDEILILGVDSLGAIDWPTDKCILVSDRLKTPDVIETLVAFGGHQFVQVGNPRFDHAINVAAAMIEQPIAFATKPVESYFAHRSKTFGVKRLAIHSLGEKPQIIDAALDYVARLSERPSVMEATQSIVDELMSNSLFASPHMKPGGHSKFAQLKRNVSVTVDPKDKVEVFLAHDDQILLVGCEDSYGTLNPTKVLGILKDCYSLGVNEAVNKSGEGSGIGCYLMLEQSISYFLIVQEGVRSVVMTAIPIDKLSKDVAPTPKNIHFLKA